MLHHRQQSSGVMMSTSSVAAINTLPRRGWWANHSGGASELSAMHSRTPMAAHKPLIARTPMVPCASMASLATADLRAELERHCSGEDNRITIKRHRERCHNLDGDFTVANTTPVRQAFRTPTSPGSGGGCMVLAPRLRMVVWTRKFHPHLPEKYDGS
jgi:hypothetical protein